MTVPNEARRALVVGATGIVGQNLCARLAAEGWAVHGLSRSGRVPAPGLIPVQADLSDADGLVEALDGVAPHLVAVTAWSRQPTERENIVVNAAAVRNVLAAVRPAGSLQHAALMTGLKHYLGPFEAYARSGLLPPTPVREEQTRLDVPNFYYNQEDEVYAAAKRDGFTWSVHRPHTIIGKAIGKPSLGYIQAPDSSFPGAPRNGTVSRT